MFGQPYSQVARWLGATAITTMTCATAAQAQPVREADYALPAQELARSLRDISARSGTSIIAPSELVTGRRALPLRGRYGARQAVEALLQGTGLRVTSVGDALVVSRNAASPEGAAAAAAQLPESEPIVVTGSNLRGAQPTSPVIVLRREQIEASGAISVEQLMAKMPQNAQTGVNRENFRVTGAGADPTEHGAGLNLRGLGQRATLVLINGRRVAPSNTGSFVDVSLIPLGAIERVEILTDGASAIYGSDAVGGVVNFILRDGFDGIETSLTAGTATQGDGDVLQMAATAGTSWSSGGAMLSYEFRAEDEILARDRDFTINLTPSTSLLPRERRHSLFGNLHQDLGPDLRAELSGSFAQRETQRSYFFAGSPVPVDQSAEAQSISLAGTLDYALGADWNVRLAGGYSVTRTDQQQVQTGGQGLVNDRFTRNEIADVGLKVDGRLFELPAGPVRLAFGVEGRRESYRDRFATRTVNVPTDISRDVGALYAEAQVPIFSAANRRPGFERLVFTAAGRFEHYEDFGSTFDPKVGLLWSPFPGLTLRSSYDTSFRAPLLSEAAGTYSAIFFPASLVHIAPGQGTGVALVMGGNDPDVQSERSRSWTIGAEIEPAPGLSLSLNYYAIRFTDRIAQPSQIVTVVGDPAFESIVTRNPDEAFVRALVDNASAILDISGPGFSNGHAMPADVTVIVDNRISNTALSTTRGMDANLQYRFTVGTSEFQLDANANYIFSFRDRLRPTSPVIVALDAPYRPLRFRLRGHAGWRQDGWSVNLFASHADDYRDNRGSQRQRIGSYTTFDATIAYEFAGPETPAWLRGTRIALQADNLFDEAPPFLLTDPGSTTGLGYDPVNASARGRFVSLQLRKRW
jgi:iron complex outermembrane recepter protein